MITISSAGRTRKYPISLKQVPFLPCFSFLPVWKGRKEVVNDTSNNPSGSLLFVYYYTILYPVLPPSWGRKKETSPNSNCLIIIQYLSRIPCFFVFIDLSKFFQTALKVCHAHLYNNWCLGKNNLKIIHLFCILCLTYNHACI